MLSCQHVHFQEEDVAHFSFTVNALQALIHIHLYVHALAKMAKEYI
jgi:hypothetical protein